MICEYGASCIRCVSWFVCAHTTQNSKMLSKCQIEKKGRNSREHISEGIEMPKHLFIQKRNGTIFRIKWEVNFSNLFIHFLYLQYDEDINQYIRFC